jgi:beta-1,4-mannosyltransferase
MNQNSLLETYSNLCPNIERLYVVPHIDRASIHNPYLHLLYQGFPTAQIRISSFSFISPVIIVRRLLGERSVLHHHWFECDGLLSFLNCTWKLLCLGGYRLAGGKVVWTIHNREPHHGKLRRVNRVLRRIWSRIPHRLHVHCNEAARIMQKELGVGNDKFVIIEHPNYPVRIISQSEARIELSRTYLLPPLESASTMLLMFGYLAPYKGIAEAVRAFRKGNVRCILCICGAVKKHGDAYLTEIREAAGEDQRVIIIDKVIPEEHMHLFFNSADYIVFNYTEVLTSGGVMLARSYGKPVIIPRKGCLPEITGERVIHFESTDELVEIFTRL